ncbi:hypothetical protein MHK_005228, partial [Candidatus Magnetomorum sp. HK-1]
WIKYEYDSYGRTVKEISPWLSSLISNPDENAHHVTIYSYDPSYSQDSQLKEHFYHPRTVTVKIKGIVTQKTYHSYIQLSNANIEHISEGCTDLSARFGNSSNLRTTEEYYPKGTNHPQSGKLYMIEYPDRRYDLYTYQNYTYKGSSALPGTDVKEIVIHGTKDKLSGIPNKMTRDITMRTAIGHVLMEETQVFDGLDIASFQT